MKHKIRSRDYTQLKIKISLQAFAIIVIALTVVVSLYSFFWRDKGGDYVVLLLQKIFHMELDTALRLYQQIFRNQVLLIWVLTTIIVVFILFQFLLSRLIKYFDEVNSGIDLLLGDRKNDIILEPELAVVEKKLNSVRKILEDRTLEVKAAEQKKNDLVVYLAHDIKTPLTSVIGYLSLLDEVQDMPEEQKKKYIHITLNKAKRLNQLINEFFEITRFNLQQIVIEKEEVDISYMLIQMADEFYPILNEHGNTINLSVEGSFNIHADAIKLARVFNNILKNAIAYSYSNTPINIWCEKEKETITIFFQNQGQTIPKEKIELIFNKFFRVDEARNSETGGTGLGLAIAKEIITLHGGSLGVVSENENTVFSVKLPI